ncbi:diaminopimelate decarboxylase [soil metagenome]
MPFDLQGGVLHAEGIALPALATAHGTPLYVYSKQSLLDAYRQYADALGDRRSLICYAVKANSNLAVLDLLARAGSGFDIVSGGELARVLAVGGDPSRIVFSGVGKTDAEMIAALEADIACFNVESAAELERLSAVAYRLGRTARISIRVNPDVDAKTHPYISTGLRDNKFGVAWSAAPAAYARAARLPGLAIVGIDCHIGSQITEIAPYVEALDRLLDLVDARERDGIAIAHIDCGGGLGVSYRDEQPPAIGALITALLERIDARGHGDKTLLFEPGRSIAAPAGLLLTRVIDLKPIESRNFAIVDAAMNDLVRPAMYDAWMDVREVAPSSAPAATWDIVGPVCESGDWLARERELSIDAGSLLAIMDAGAYGMSMASNYNTRPRAAEVIVDGTEAFVVRRRETIDDLIALESPLPR